MVAYMVHYLGALQSRLGSRRRYCASRGAVVAALQSRLAVGGATVQVAALWWGRCGHGYILLMFNVKNVNTVFQNTKFFTYTFRKFPKLNVLKNGITIFYH
jgi:hypothetical protein